MLKSFDKKDLLGTGSKRTHQLSSESLNYISAGLKSGDRQNSRRRLSVDLGINDALAEISLKHYESKASDIALDDNQAKILDTESSTSEEFERVLGELFGIRGKAAATIARKQKRQG